MLAPIAELDSRPGDERRHRSGDEHLAGVGGGHDPGRDVHGDPADVVTEKLDLTGVQAYAQLQAERFYRGLCSATHHFVYGDIQPDYFVFNNP